MYKISLPNFEGPFDLLLFFIRKEELNIYDIPIYKITREFLNYVRLMQLFDLELAGEFLVMAATLMQIKTKLLLPKDEKDGEEIEDPRTPLIERLLEYKQFKLAGGELAEKFDDQKYTYYRQIFEQDEKIAANSGNFMNATLFHLMRAFKAVMERSKEEPLSHVVEMIPVTVEEKTLQIKKLLKSRPRVNFFQLTTGEPRINVIVTFLALLEMIKNRLVFITQDENFEDIVIARRPDTN